jgi:hypothetical protein
MPAKDLTSDDSSDNQSNAIVRAYNIYCIKHQQMLDRCTPHTVARWVFWVVIVASYLVRVFFLHGWYIVTYAVGIYMLNQFIAFLTPKIDPAMQDYEEDGLSLPTKSSEEFRPFMRQLPELKFWYSTLRAILIGFFCTFFDFFNVPVFWPILVMYFIVLFLVTMKKQIRHMIKYKYLPFTHGKTHYKGKADSSKVIAS